MTIIRSPRDDSDGYYLLRRSIREDSRLSWAARGMLIFLLGKPDHWQIGVTNLIDATAGSDRQAGKAAVYAILTELIDAGYIQRKKQATGETLYFVHESPAGAGKPNPENRNLEKPNPENPNLGNPDLGFQPLVINEEKKIRSLLSSRQEDFNSAAEILNYLNLKTGKAFKPVKANLSLIANRLKEFTADELKAVIDDRVLAWKGDAKMDPYLRPATLFCATNCASYHGNLAKPAADKRFKGGI